MYQVCFATSLDRKVHVLAKPVRYARCAFYFHQAPRNKISNVGAYCSFPQVKGSTACNGILRSTHEACDSTGSTWLNANAQHNVATQGWEGCVGLSPDVIGDQFCSPKIGREKECPSVALTILLWKSGSKEYPL